MTCGFGRFLAAVLLVGVLCAGSAFAGMASDGSDTKMGEKAFQSIPRLIAFLSGAIPGGIIMVKFMFDMVKAYGDRERNPQGIQKAVVNFLIVVGVLLCYAVVVMALFKEDSGGNLSPVTYTPGSGEQIADSSKDVGQRFYKSLSGAEVPLDWLAEHGFELPAGGAAPGSGL